MPPPHSLHPITAPPHNTTPQLTHLLVPPLDKVAHLGRPGQDQGRQFPNGTRLFLGRVVLVPLAEAGLALPAHQEEEVDHDNEGAEEWARPLCLYGSGNAHGSRSCTMR